MLSYTVKYRVPGTFFWTTIKNVVGDGIITHIGPEQVPLAEPYRFLSTTDLRVIHLPYKVELKFGPERDTIITKNMSKQAGQAIQRANDE